MSDELSEMILEAHKRSFQRAFETAVRTGTALVFERDGKIVEIKPPYRYELVPIRSKKKKKKTRALKKKS
ncbi:MAG: hypothetical protein HZB76_01855 [Chlamydiae bacterium]|nr:hypothetical protein [Chlamydiota bacterium]